MDVVAAAWRGMQRPPVVSGQLCGGRCARCASADAVVPASAAVSKNFTAWDGWAGSGSGVCAACAWAYQHPGLRQHCYLVEPDPPRLTQLEGPALREVLSAPLPSMAAVTVPLRRGRTHLLPIARWGRVTVDHASLSWTAGDAARLAAVGRLHRSGFGSQMVQEASPPYGVMRRTPPDQWSEVLGDWELLRPWRERPAWLMVALRAHALEKLAVAA